MVSWDDPAASSRRRQSHHEFDRQRAGRHHQDVTVTLAPGQVSRRYRAEVEDGHWVITEDTIPASVAGEADDSATLPAVVRFDLDTARSLHDALRGVIAFIDAQAES